ncbi:Pimeloyl-ACP methyl ester carboxylesterase [Micromonospora rhizosphaerae]|uniref:Pimeloyl-ACP methyl ester carboxylesterase n=2 Tax=Micromonospora rhizosphaerae TaxID=568872 RepID=A0A1C6SLD8_9ACTN|nr:Pimeloyl-ACP methyl ester carboxylesterase [Micromonospora rhizosphaerae]
MHQFGWGNDKPTVVLVHGGFADATNSWDKVVKRLQDQGYPVMAPANPLRGLATDSAYLASVLDSIEGPIVLVGHSYGGAVITNAAANDPDVKALVYIAAFVPDNGETLGELISKYPGSEIQAALNHVPYPNPDGSTGTDLYIKADRFRDVFAADLPKSTTTVMSATQRPFSAQSFADPTQAAAWHTIPSWGLVATADKAIPAELERFEYERAGAREVVEVSGASHSVMASQPGVVTELIVEAANATD